MYFSVEHVKPLGDFKILVSFENHEERVFDVRPYLKLGIFQELKDPKLFSTVHVSFDSVAWSNSADLDPEILYRDSVPA